MDLQVFLNFFYRACARCLLICSTLQSVDATQKQYRFEEEMLRSVHKKTEALQKDCKNFSELALEDKISIHENHITFLEETHEASKQVNQIALQTGYKADRLVSFLAESRGIDAEKLEKIKTSRFIAPMNSCGQDYDTRSKINGLTKIGEVGNLEVAVATLEKARDFLAGTLHIGSQAKEFPGNITAQEIENLKDVVQDEDPARIQNDASLKKIFEEDLPQILQCNNPSQYYRENNGCDRQQLSERLRVTFSRKLYAVTEKIDKVIEQFTINHPRIVEKIKIIINEYSRSKTKKKITRQRQKAIDELQQYALYKGFEDKALCIATARNLLRLVDESVSVKRKAVAARQAMREEAMYILAYKNVAPIKQRSYLLVALQANRYIDAKKYCLSNPMMMQAVFCEALHTSNDDWIASILSAHDESIQPLDLSSELRLAIGKKDYKVLRLLSQYVRDAVCLASFLVDTIMYDDLASFSILIEAPYASVIQPNKDGVLPIFTAIVVPDHGKFAEIALGSVKEKQKNFKGIVSDLRDINKTDTLFDAAIKSNKIGLAYNMVREYAFPMQQAFTLVNTYIGHAYGLMKDDKKVGSYCFDSFTKFMENILLAHKLLKLQKQCKICAKPAKELCKGCKAVCYCSRFCQKIDWCMHKKIILVDQKSQLPLLWGPSFSENFLAIKPYSYTFSRFYTLTFCTISSADMIDKVYKMIKEYTFSKQKLAEKSSTMKKYKEILFITLDKQLTPLEEKITLESIQATVTPLCCAVGGLITKSRGYQQ